MLMIALLESSIILLSLDGNCSGARLVATAVCPGGGDVVGGGVVGADGAAGLVVVALAVIVTLSLEVSSKFNIILLKSLVCTATTAIIKTRRMC